MDFFSNDDQQTSTKERLERVGAGVLAGMAMLVSVELTLEHAHGGHHDSKTEHSAVSGSGSGMGEVLARAEGKGETARLPEEFDIGLQTPDISGL